MKTEQRGKTGKPPEFANLARRLMQVQLRLMIRNESGVLTGRFKPLHDFRVALRRLRSLLRSLENILSGLRASDLDRRLDDLQDSLGPSRDFDVWLQFLQTKSMARHMTDTPGWTRFLREQDAGQVRHKRLLRGIFRGRDYAALKRDLASFIREDLKRVVADADSPSCRRASKQALARALRQMEKRSRIEPDFAPEAIHRLRIACRRARYMAEFFGEVLGRPVRELGSELKRLQNTLGDIHDLDVFAGRLRGSPDSVARTLRTEVIRRRKRKIRKLRKNWYALGTRDLQKKAWRIIGR